MKQVNFTNDELHAFSEHYTWIILDQELPLDDHMQSFIDKVLYDNQNSVTKDSYFIKTKNYTIGEDNSPYNEIPKRY